MARVAPMTAVFTLRQAGVHSVPKTILTAKENLKRLMRPSKTIRQKGGEPQSFRNQRGRIIFLDASGKEPGKGGKRPRGSRKGSVILK